MPRRVAANKNLTVTSVQLVEAFYRFIYTPQSPWSVGAWRGTPILKNPLDLMVMQELINRLKPDLIIETGTRVGGSTLFWADMCELQGKGRVISIDKDVSHWGARPKHKRIKYYKGSSTARATLAFVKRECAKAQTVLVNLDSDHHRDHVFRELQMYGPLVTLGSYMIVEDTNVNGHPVHPEFGPGPWEAVHEYLRDHQEFVQDRACEAYGITWNPGGWLMKVGFGGPPKKYNVVQKGRGKQ